MAAILRRMITSSFLEQKKPDNGLHKQPPAPDPRELESGQSRESATFSPAS